MRGRRAILFHYRGRSLPLPHHYTKCQGRCPDHYIALPIQLQSVPNRSLPVGTWREEVGGGKMGEEVRREGGGGGKEGGREGGGGGKEEGKVGKEVRRKGRWGRLGRGNGGTD